MIKRIWHGWTTPDDADRYQRLLEEEIFHGIEAMEVPGLRGIDLLRRDRGHEVEFVTIMTFDSLDAVRAFAGEDYEAAYVPASERSGAGWDEVSKDRSPVSGRERRLHIREWRRGTFPNIGSWPSGVSSHPPGRSGVTPFWGAAAALRRGAGFHRESVR